jgi:hypothetical protein
MPTSGPIFISLTLCEKMSPSEPACSLVSVTTGPATASSGYGADVHPARVDEGDAPARDLLEQQLRDVAAAVVADVDDQRVALAFVAEVAVELGEAGRLHVGNVEVADAAARALVHPRAVLLDPLAVVDRHVVGERRDDDVAPPLAGFAASLARASCTFWPARWTSKASGGSVFASGWPSTATMRSPTFGLDADRVERRIGARIPRVAARDLGDLPAAARVVPARRRGEVAERDRGRLAMVAAHFVRVRGAELALHLPDEVGEVGARRDAVEQRCVEAPDRVPVDAGEVGRPELVALQAPDLAQHLAPLATRLDGDANAVEVDAAVLARRRAVGVGRVGLGLGLAVGGDRAQRLAVAVDERDAVAGDREIVDLLGEGLGAAGREVEALELAGRFLVAAAAVRADDVLRVPDDLRAGHAGDAAIAPFGDRERR